MPPRKKYTLTNEPYFSLQAEDGWTKAADCGCQLGWSDGVISLYQCTLHAAAAEMLEAVRAAHFAIYIHDYHCATEDGCTAKDEKDRCSGKAMWQVREALKKVVYDA